MFPKKALISIYYSVFQSYIACASTNWPFVSQQNMKKTFVLQKKCERLLTFSDFSEPTNPIFKSLKILN